MSAAVAWYPDCLCDNEEKQLLDKTHNLWERNQNENLKCNLVAIELDSTIAFTSTFMGITVRSCLSLFFYGFLIFICP